MVLDQLFPIRGQIVPSSGHLKKLIALLPLGHLLGKHPALFSVFSVFGGSFHTRLYGSRQLNGNSLLPHPNLPHSLGGFMRDYECCLSRLQMAEKPENRTTPAHAAAAISPKT